MWIHGITWLDLLNLLSRGRGGGGRGGDLKERIHVLPWQSGAKYDPMSYDVQNCWMVKFQL